MASSTLPGRALRPVRDRGDDVVDRAREGAGLQAEAGPARQGEGDVVRDRIREVRLGLGAGAEQRDRPAVGCASGLGVPGLDVSLGRDQMRVTGEPHVGRRVLGGRLDLGVGAFECGRAPVAQQLAPQSLVHGGRGRKAPQGCAQGRALDLRSFEVGQQVEVCGGVYVAARRVRIPVSHGPQKSPCRRCASAALGLTEIV